MIRPPGRSWSAPLPPPDALERELQRPLEQHVRTLAGRIGERNLWHPAALAQAAGYVREAPEAGGHPVRRQPFDVQGREVANLEAVHPGAAREAGVLVVGAHYDSVRGSPGANDNATGVAALIEIARLLAPLATRRELRLVAFVNEEPPFSYGEHMGSLVYARALARSGARVTGMLALETLGFYSDRPGSQRHPFPLGLFYPDRGDFVGFVANLGSRRLLHAAIASFRRHPRRRLVRPLVVLAPGSVGHHGHRHGAVPLRAVPHRRGPPGHRRLRTSRARGGGPRARRRRAGRRRRGPRRGRQPGAGRLTLSPALPQRVHWIPARRRERGKERRRDPRHEVHLLPDRVR